MAQLQQIQKQHANQQQQQFQSARDHGQRCSKGPGGSSSGGSGSIPHHPPLSLALPLPLPSSVSGARSGFGSDRPTPTKAQLTMPPRLNHKHPGLVCFNPLQDSNMVELSLGGFQVILNLLGHFTRGLRQGTVFENHPKSLLKCTKYFFLQ